MHQNRHLHVGVGCKTESLGIEAFWSPTGISCLETSGRLQHDSLTGEKSISDLTMITACFWTTSALACCSRSQSWKEMFLGTALCKNPWCGFCNTPHSWSLLGIDLPKIRDGIARSEKSGWIVWIPLLCTYLIVWTFLSVSMLVSKKPDFISTPMEIP